MVDTGGGHISTITRHTCLILHTTNHSTELAGYQDKSEPKTLPIVHCAIKAHVRNIDQPIILILNYVSLLDDNDEHESLLQPFTSMKHGIRMDLTPTLYGGESGMQVDGQFIPFEFDGEKLFLNIERPTWEDMEYFDIFELTSPFDEGLLQKVVPRRNKKKLTHEDIPLVEWRRRLALLPDDIIHRTLECTTQYYMNAEIENRQNPRDHIKSRFPGLRVKRQNEPVASDTFFPAVVTNRGHTCSQFFTTLESDRWDVFPLKTEAQNITALQDYTRTVGAPTSIKTDNAQSELGLGWTKHLRDICTASETTEPHHPWQNPAERKIGALGAMVRNAMRTFNVPLTRHDYCQKWCCAVHNVVANRKLGWRSPLERNTGNTPDISKFRFHIWEPVWYYEPSKQPKDNLKKARWLGFADSAGDEFTYLIEPEEQTGKHRKVLIRSNIKTRRKNIGKDTEFVNDNPEYADFFLSPAAATTNMDEQVLDCSDLESGDGDGPVTDTGDPVLVEDDDLHVSGIEQELAGLSPQEMSSIYDQHYLDSEVDDCVFDRITGHEFRDGVLFLKVRYSDSTCMGEHTIDVPFPVLKVDAPINVAKYIRDHVIESKRNGFYNRWAKLTLRNTARSLRRFSSITGNGEPFRVRRTPGVSKQRVSRNTRNSKKANREKFGIRIPNNIKEALLFDSQNGDTKWADAIAKEMQALERLNCFEFVSPTTDFQKSDGWQYAPMHMIFDIKQEDLRYKARLVMGGHVVDSSAHTTYSSTISDISVRLLFLIATQNNLELMVGDVGNAFPTAPCAEKIWSTAGPEFHHQGKEGSRVILKRALYGLKTASRSFHEFFGDKLRRMGFTSSRADQDLWLRPSDDYQGYDYIATHVDDLIIAAKHPSKYMDDIEQEFSIRNKSHSPSYYLGNDIKTTHKKKYMHVSTKKYVTEIIRRFRQTYGDIRKENLPMPTKAHPELDDSPLLNPEEVKQYQHIIGVGQWLVVAGRFDINFAISSLSRFASYKFKYGEFLKYDFGNFPK